MLQSRRHIAAPVDACDRAATEPRHFRENRCELSRREIESELNLLALHLHLRGPVPVEDLERIPVHITEVSEIEDVLLEEHVVCRDLHVSLASAPCRITQPGDLRR